MWRVLLACFSANGWHRPAEVQPLDVPHHQSPRHVQFLADMGHRHAKIAPTLHAINKTYGAVTLMVVNSGQMVLLRNFIAACDHRNLPCKDMIFVFALDRSAAASLKDAGIHHYHYPFAETPTAAKVFSDRHFAAVVFYKNAVVYDVLLTGVNVLFQDVDLVWKANPIASLAAFRVDMCFMNDGNSMHQQPLYINSGFFYVFNNAKTLHFWREAFQIFNKHSSQQGLLERLLVHHYFNNNLTLFVLPPLYANGNQWTPINPHQMLTSRWLVAHASWTHNMTYKVAKFKTIREWYL